MGKILITFISIIILLNSNFFSFSEELDDFVKKIQEEQKEELKLYEKINRFNDELLNFIENITLDNIQNKFGKPKKIKKIDAFSPQVEDYLMGYYYKIYYNKLEIEILYLIENDEYKLRELIIKDSSIVFNNGIKIGISKKDIIDILGDKHTQENNNILKFDSYKDIPQPRPDSIIEFHFNKRNKLIKIKYLTLFFT